MLGMGLIETRISRSCVHRFTGVNNNRATIGTARAAIGRWAAVHARVCRRAGVQLQCGIELEVRIHQYHARVCGCAGVQLQRGIELEVRIHQYHHGVRVAGVQKRIICSVNRLRLVVR
jgi:hypothetical protein